MGRRSLVSGSPRLTNDPVQPIIKGGTDSTTLMEVKETFGLLSKGMKNQPNGFLAVVGSYIPISTLGITDFSVGDTVDGPLSLKSGEVGTYTITNYDSQRTYNVTATEGSASLSGDKILYTPPSKVGVFGFSINGRVVGVNVSMQEPVITGPTTLTVNASGTYTITNYESARNYVVSSTMGSVTRNGATITYTAPSFTGNFGFTVDGKVVSVVINALPTPIVTGPNSLEVGKTGTYTITNYDSTRNYSLTATGGTVSRSGATITYTAPATANSYSFTVDDLRVNVTVVPLAEPTVSGPTSLEANKVGTYTITNFDSTRNYTVTAGSGTVSRSGATITYTAPSSTGMYGFTVDGKLVSVNIVPLAEPTVSGPTSMNAGTSSTFTITNYDSNRNYTVTAISGTVSRSGSAITYTAPTTEGSYGFTIDGKTVSVNVVIPKPTISGPTSLVVSTTGTYTITNYNSAFTYTLQSIDGTISRNGATIYYTAPSVAASSGFGFLVNGNIFDVAVTEAPVPEPTISGPSSLTANSSGTYTITNYDSSRTYNVTANGGSVTRSGNTITYTAPSTAGSYGFTVNTKVVNVTVTAITINTPSITSPVNGATGISGAPTITSSVFSVTGGSDTHYSSDWLVATDSGFSNIVRTVTDSTTLLTTISLTSPTPGTTYYVKVRYKGSTYGYSAWSNVSSFSTSAVTYPRTEQAKLVPIDPVQSISFGYSVSISGDGNTVIAGVPIYGNNGSRSGSVFIYTRSGGTWSQQAKLTASDGAADDQFGYSVSISGDGNTVIVGSPGDDDGDIGTGSAYIFIRNGSSWSQQAKLKANDAVMMDSFGHSVAISGDGNTVFVGAPFSEYDISNAQSGGGYIFIRSGFTWSLQYNFNMSGSEAKYGRFVSLSHDGSVAAIGNDAENFQDFAIFTRSGTTWTKIDLPFYGGAVAVSGDGGTIIGGVSSESSGVGAVYIHTRSGSIWTQHTKILGDSNSASEFGSSVSLSYDGKTAVIGAKNDSVAKGCIYIYQLENNVWLKRIKLQVSDPSDFDWFGCSVDISNDGSVIVSGAYSDDNNRGSAYIFV